MIVFLVSNSKDFGQYYYDKKNGVLFNCHFKRPAPGMEIVPFSWVLLISFFAFIFLLPQFFICPYTSILLNVCSFALELCLVLFYMKKKRMQVEKEGTAYILRNLDLEELKALKRDFFRGIAIYSGLFYTFFGGMVFMIFVLVVIFFYGKQYILSFTLLLYGIEFWGYDYYFTRKKYQKAIIKEIDSLLCQHIPGTGDGSLSHDENSN
jgi:hypothetical protein